MAQKFQASAKLVEAKPADVWAALQKVKEVKSDQFHFSYKKKGELKHEIVWETTLEIKNAENSTFSCLVKPFEPTPAKEGEEIPKELAAMKAAIVSVVEYEPKGLGALTAGSQAKKIAEESAQAITDLVHAHLSKN